MIVLDTTVLGYAKGAEDPLRDPSRPLFAAGADRGPRCPKGLLLFQRAERRGAFDALLAAAALSAGAQALVSADAGFAAVPNLPHVVSDEHGVSSILQSSRGTSGLR